MGIIIIAQRLFRSPHSAYRYRREGNIIMKRSHCERTLPVSQKKPPETFGISLWRSFYKREPFYSVLSAVTGSLFAAFLEGIIPPRSVSNTLKAINITAPLTGRKAVISLVLAR